MDYYKKYIKYKTKYLQLGGMINWHVQSNIIPTLTVVIPLTDVNNMRTVVQAHPDSEMCGKYVAAQCINNNGAACLLKCHNVVNQQQPNSESRANCIVDDKTRFGILWHTHPANGKFYPSAEDIISIKKIRGYNPLYDTTKLSIIFQR